MPAYSCDPNLELTGYATLALLEHLDRHQIETFLVVHDLVDVAPDGWVKVTNILNLMNDFARAGGSMGNFVALGIKAAELAPLPPEMEAMSFPDFLLAYRDVYQQRHRNGDPGSLTIEFPSNHHAVVHCINVPYPDDLVYGVLFGFAQRVFPTATQFSIFYDEKILAREQGGDATLLHVVWED